MRRRVNHEVETEFSTALDEIAKIAQLRLRRHDFHLTPAMPAKLSTHVLDLSIGRPAQGMRVELWSCGRRGAPPRCHHDERRWTDGRTVARRGQHGDRHATSLVFHVRTYFAGRGVGCDFLDRVPIRFTIADAAASYHVPLLVTPWAYQTYRGS
jgi:5-hydroxyisourate hydrolase